MSRKHFATIALVCNIQRKQFKSDRCYAEFCITMGEAIKEYNDNFNMNKFLEACHVPKNAVVGQKDLI